MERLGAGRGCQDHGRLLVVSCWALPPRNKRMCAVGYRGVGMYGCRKDYTSAAALEPHTTATNMIDISQQKKPCWGQQVLL